MNLKKIIKNTFLIFKKVLYPYKGIGYKKYSSGRVVFSSSHCRNVKQDKTIRLNDVTQKQGYDHPLCKNDDEEYFDGLDKRNERKLLRYK